MLKALDLCCKAGGVSRGLQHAGFHVTGVDIEPQRHYGGDEFVLGDVLSLTVSYLRQFDFLTASPPCQAHTNAWKIRGRDHPDLIGPIRGRFIESGRPWCIENVPGAPLIDPIELCGAMFGLRTYRHRLFECSFQIAPPPHPEHVARQAKMGRPVRDGEFIQVVGNFSNVALGREAMSIDWMTRDELREAIPPAYSEYIGRAAIAHLRRAA